MTHLANHTGLETCVALCSGSVDIAAKTMDIELAKAGLHMMIEKPISMRPVEEVERLAQVILAKHTCQMSMCVQQQCQAGCIHAHSRLHESSCI